MSTTKQSSPHEHLITVDSIDISIVVLVYCCLELVTRIIFSCLGFSILVLSPPFSLSLSPVQFLLASSCSLRYFSVVAYIYSNTFELPRGGSSYSKFPFLSCPAGHRPDQKSRFVFKVDYCAVGGSSVNVMGHIFVLFYISCSE